MTENEWDTTSDALAMLRHLRVVYDPGPVSEPGHRPQPLISHARLRAWVEACRALWGSPGAYDLGTQLLEAACVWAGPKCARHLPGEPRLPLGLPGAERRAALLRCVVGSPFRPAALHDLYRAGDRDAPGAILDPNGDVALALCRRCGKGEKELAGPCFWATPTVFALAKAARLERPGQACGRCGGSGVLETDTGGNLWQGECPGCQGSGRQEDGLLDNRLLGLVADALLDAGMPEDSPLLAHLQSQEPHCRACHALALVLGEES